MVNNLNNGLSGCILTLDDRCVIKKSHLISYNERLRRQMEKQKSFSKFTIKGIKNPRIINDGVEDGLYYFSMDYIPGIQPLDLFVSGSIHEIHNFAYCVNNYVKFLISSSKPYDISEFKDNCIRKIDNLIEISKYKDFIKFLKEKILKINFKTYDKSFCHGDIALSNMICYDNNVYLIDFLDSFINSPIVDLVKLKQDLYYGWFLNNLNYTNQDYYRALQVSRYVWENIERMYELYINSEIFFIIESLNFLRIEPYINKDSMVESLNKIITSLPLHEEFINTNGWEINKVSKHETKVDVKPSNDQ